MEVNGVVFESEVGIEPPLLWMILDDWFGLGPEVVGVGLIL